jgi:hypothetical protein
LLLVFIFSLMPAPGAAAEEQRRELQHSLDLLHAGRSVLLDQADQENAERAPSLGEKGSSEGREGPDAGAALGQLIHATKQQRSNLKDSCRQLKAAYRDQGKTCELQVLNEYCSAQEAKLNRRIGFLHKLRGDRRKLFTRLWHTVKRTGSRVWSAVGPVGRRILRRVGPETAEIVLSGGSLGGGVFREILIREARSVGEAELKRLVDRGLTRFLHGQAALARAAGVGDCSEVELDSARDEVREDVGDQVPGSDQENCPADGSWLSSLWSETIYPELVAEGRSCNSVEVYAYQDCLRLQAGEGACPLEAVERCETDYPGYPGGLAGAVSLSPDVIHSEARNVQTRLTFTNTGGGAGGSISYSLQDHTCTITVSSTLQGTYDPASCAMSGTAQLTYTYEGVACPSVCGSGPNSETACPVTRSGAVPWQAAVKNDQVTGGVGSSSGDLGLVGFSGEP